MFRPRISFHEAGLNGFVYFCKQFRDRTDAYLFLSVFRTPDRQRCAPITAAAEVPVVQVIQPLSETSCTCRFGLPVNCLVEGNHLVARHSGTYKPAVQRVVQHRLVRTPAVRIRVHMLLCLEHPSVGFHLQTQMQIQCLIFVRQRRVVGVLNEASCVAAIERVVYVGLIPFRVEVFHFPVLTREVHHRTRTVVLGLHIQSRHTCSIGYALIVRTESRSDMHYTRTVVRRHVVARNNAPSVLQFYPREQRLILQSHKVCTFVACYDLRSLAQFFGVGAHTCLRKNDMIFADFHFHIVNLRSYAQSGVRRQRPRCRRPSDDITTIF